MLLSAHFTPTRCSGTSSQRRQPVRARPGVQTQAVASLLSGSSRTLTELPSKAGSEERVTRKLVEKQTIPKWISHFEAFRDTRPLLKRPKAWSHRTHCLHAAAVIRCGAEHLRRQKEAKAAILGKRLLIAWTSKVDSQFWLVKADDLVVFIKQRSRCTGSLRVREKMCLSEL